MNAPRADVYRALIDQHAVARWMVPDGMTSHVHSFEGREGGTFRISLTYDEPTATGKTTAHTDTYHGRFVRQSGRERHRVACAVPLAVLPLALHSEAGTTSATVAFLARRPG